MQLGLLLTYRVKKVLTWLLLILAELLLLWVRIAIDWRLLVLLLLRGSLLLVLWDLGLVRDRLLHLSLRW